MMMRYSFTFKSIGAWLTDLTNMKLCTKTVVALLESTKVFSRKKHLMEITEILE